MTVEDFKKSYIRWSYAIAVAIPAILMAITICDSKLDLDFSRNMYVMSIVATSVLLSFLSLTWISVLNSKLFMEWVSRKTTPEDGQNVEQKGKETIDFSHIEQCIKKEGFVPVRRENHISFKVSGEEIEVFYNDEKLSLVLTYGLDEDENLDAISQACSMLHDSTFLIRSSLHKYPNNQMGIVFEVQTLLTSPEELDRHFSSYLNLLYHGKERHREFHAKLVEKESNEAKGKPSTQIHEQKVVS